MWKRFWEWLKTFLADFWHRFEYFWHHPYQVLSNAAKKAGSAIWRFIKYVATGIWKLLKMVPRRAWIILGKTAAGLFLFIVISYSLLFSWIERQAAPDTRTYEIRYLDQGWGMAAGTKYRQGYYFTPQGAYLRFVRYDWLVNLERPWKKDRFASPEYMRGYGFVVEPTELDANPGRLPVGLAPRWSIGLGNMMVDVTCAACHTGELHIAKDGKDVAVRVDGGPAMHALTYTQPGHFAADLFASLFATYVNPLKWRRFAANVLREQNNSENRAKLSHDFGQVLSDIWSQTLFEIRHGIYPRDEGFGRTDALGRIANGVFGTNLDDRNYHVADAPVSYPPVWDIWKFDWVQYTASVSQPMARNIGESMGTGAKYSLLDAYDRRVPPSERYNASTLFANLHHIEDWLQNLKPPCWPEDLFGNINWELAKEGAGLFRQHCEKCHGPFPASAYQKRFDAPLKKPDDPHWIMHALPVEEIGTDPTSALNFVHGDYDLTPTGLSPDEVRNQLSSTWSRYYERRIQYDEEVKKTCIAGSQNFKAADAELTHLRKLGVAEYMREKIGPMNLAKVSNGEGLNYLIAFMREEAYQVLDLDDKARANYDGFGQLDTPQVKAQYKARPLAGVWATAPYLHNGSVPNLYQLLSPAYLRDKQFYIWGRTFDPYRVGLYANSNQKGAYLYDTTVRGNSNGGHEFRAGYRVWQPGDPPSYGVIGPELTDHERWALIEYLKVHRDDPDDMSCGYHPILPPKPNPPDPACYTAAKPTPAEKKP